MNRADYENGTSRTGRAVSYSKGVLWLLSLAVTACCLDRAGVSAAQGQGAPPTRSRPRVQPSDRVMAASETKKGTSPDSAASNPEERPAPPGNYRELYVPTDELDAVLDPGAKTVLLPREQFAKLFQAACANQRRRPPTEAPILITQAEYAAHIEGERLLIRGKLHIRQVSDGWALLPLPFSGLAIEKATLNGRPARLGLLAAGRPVAPTGQHQPARGTDVQTVLQLVHDQAGPAVLELELSTELTGAGRDRMALFSLPPSPAARMRLTVPAGQRVVVAGAEP
ncbi:MAG TPA: hypothetical protein EYP14_05645, partial [Planctomycetaceae bacterium]|nr:hypothetical protein [Planctomycetaceae bacterium]